MFAFLMVCRRAFISLHHSKSKYVFRTYNNQVKFNIFQVIDMKTLYFHVNLLTYKSFYRLSTKFMQKYNVNHVNNLKSTVQFTLK